MNPFDRHRIFLYQNYLLYGIAFFFPLIPKLVPLLIVSFGILSVFAIAKGYSRAEMSEVSVLLVIFFLLHILGMFYTENTTRGWFNLEVKLSLLAFPLAFVGFRFITTTNFERTLRFFLWGTMIASAFCILQSSYKVLILGARYYHFITSRLFR